MIYHRTGTCNKCGECCGFPRPDGTQFQPWPETLITGTQNWTPESIQESPFFKVFKHPKLNRFGAGHLLVDHKRYLYAWDIHKGLCRPNGDVMCPFLNDSPGEHPCNLYGTDYHWIWQSMCENTPPILLEEEALEVWKKNYPSCSHVYVPIEEPEVTS